MSQAPITRTAEYAIRAMTCIAAAPDPPVRAAELSDCAGVPRAYLSKILRQLVVAGLLRSRKGHHGGFTLARLPADVRIIDILAAVDEDPSTGRCAFGWGACDQSAPCPVHDVWKGMIEPYARWAREHSLADLDLERLPS